MFTSPRLAAVLAIACATGAYAQESRIVAPKTAIAPRLTDDEISDVKAYWTADRLSRAIPMTIPTVDSASVPEVTPKAPEPLHISPGQAPTASLPAGDEISSERFPLTTLTENGLQATPDATTPGFNYEMPFTNFRPGEPNTYPYTTIGKLFFVIPKGASEAAGDYVCSAAVTGGNHLVITARHCVFDTTNKIWYGSWVFYPGWNNGSDKTLGGAWYPHTVATWTTGSATVLSLTGGYDIAMMTMHDSTGTGCNGDKGKTIGTYTGWLGWTYGGNFSQRQWNIFGYPQAAPFEGNYLYNDEGATGQVNPLGSSDVVEVGNPQTGGTSGGPWVIGLDPRGTTDPNPSNNTNPGSTNLSNGVNSFKWTSPAHPLSINGTVFFEDNFDNLLTYTTGLSCT